MKGIHFIDLHYFLDVLAYTKHGFNSCVKKYFQSIKYLEMFKFFSAFTFLNLIY